MDASLALPRLRFCDSLKAADDPALELRAGLSAAAASIAPKFFYDRLGARLFEAICELSEYTLPRDEQVIFDRHTADITQAVGPDCTLIDLGAGNCAKAERLFPALAPRQYVAIDIAAAFLREQLTRVAQRHPQIEMIGVATDFSSGLALPASVRAQRRLAFYPGSSIGNFAPLDARAFLSSVHAACNGGYLLLGADLVKDPVAQVAAYDDALGVTAAFNLNVLNVANRLAGTDFLVSDWRHVARFNETESRMEMHLEARRDLVVCWPGGERRFAAGELIHTENSYKYTRSGLTGLLHSAGYRNVRLFTDPSERFVVALAE